MNRHIIKFWGVLDFVYVAFYLIGMISSGHIPFVWEIEASILNTQAYENNLPLYMTLASLSLLMSMIWTGFILVKENANWFWMIYLQFPFRIFLVMPSVFFLALIFPKSADATQASIVGILIIVIESLKVYSIYKSKKLLNQTLQNIQAKAPEFMN